MDQPTDDLDDDLEVAVRPDDEGLRVDVRGELDVHTAPRLHEALSSVVAGGTPMVSVHLDGLGFLDSTGLGVLVAAWKAQRAAGGDLELVTTAPRVRRLLEVTGLHTVLRVRPEVGR